MAIDQFLTYLQHEKRYSLHTVQSYQIDLDQFSAYIEQTYELNIMDAAHTHVRDFLVNLIDQGMTSSSVNRKLSALRSFFKYYLRQGAISVSPMTLIKAPKLPQRIPVFIEDQKMDLLLDSGRFFDDSFPSVRDKLVLEALFGTGMRLSELIALKESDVDVYAGCIRVTGKRNKERIIPISKPLVNQIKAYLELKSFQNFNNKSGALFVNNKGKDVYPDLIYKTVQRYLTYISTQDKKSPHVLRHSYATSLLNRGADLNAIKELLGHASLAATQVYTHNSIERLKSIYKQAHPKA